MATTLESITANVYAAADYLQAQSTGNRTSLITVTATSGLLAAGTTADFIDGSNNQQAVIQTGNQVGKSLTFDFGTARIVNGAKFYCDPNVNYGTWGWYGSNDNSSYTLLGTFLTNGNASPHEMLWSNLIAYRYYKWEMLSGSVASIWLHQIEFKIRPTPSKNLTVIRVDGVDTVGWGADGMYVKNGSDWALVTDI